MGKLGAAVGDNTVGVIKRNDDTFLAELGETFVVPTEERDKCARWSQAVRELEGRIEAVWPAAAVPVAAGERPARRVEQARQSPASPFPCSAGHES